MVSEAVPVRDGHPRGMYAKTPQRRRQIVEAAAAVFAAHGYSGGSLRQVAKDIGVSVTSVMHHFPSKELLLEAVLEHADTEAVREVEPDAARDGLLGTVELLAGTGRAHPQLLRLLAVLSAEASDTSHPAHDWFVDRYRRVEDGIVAWIADDPGLALGVEDAEARLLARRIIAVWDGLQLQWLLRRDFDYVGELVAAVDCAHSPIRGNRVAALTYARETCPRLSRASRSGSWTRRYARRPSGWGRPGTAAAQARGASMPCRWRSRRR